MPDEGRNKKEAKKSKAKNKQEEDQDAEGEYDLADIMAELKTQRRDIISRLEGIESRLENVTMEVTTMKSALSQTHEGLKKQHQRLDAAEQRISDLEDILQTTNRDLHRAQELIKTLETKTDDLENRGRRKNLVLLGLPEQSEHQHLLEFIQQKIPEWLHLPMNQAGPPEIERAHRLGRLRPHPEPGGPGDPPRPIMIRFLRFRDSYMIFQAAKKKTTPIREGKAELIFRQDLSAEIRRKRNEFAGVIEYLREKNMFRGFAYPDRLRILHKGIIELVDTPLEAKAYIDKLNTRHVETDSPSNN